jgi:hypothetical protein
MDNSNYKGFHIAAMRTRMAAALTERLSPRRRA